MLLSVCHRQARSLSDSRPTSSSCSMSFGFSTKSWPSWSHSTRRASPSCRTPNSPRTRSRYRAGRPVQELIPGQRRCCRCPQGPHSSSGCTACPSVTGLQFGLSIGSLTCWHCSHFMRGAGTLRCRGHGSDSFVHHKSRRRRRIRPPWSDVGPRAIDG